MKQNVLKQSGKYTIATFEYMGLFTYSLMKRSGIALARGSKISILPAYKATLTTCRYIKDKATGREIKKAYFEKFKSLEEKINFLENKVAFFEKHGIKLKSDSSAEKLKRKKEVGADKKQFLQAILNDNKFVMGLQTAAA
ncbi:magnetosome protein Mad11 [Candidatus Magnetomorum sp. HK-1]|nr:magnetosome protein Mad11 [Candidatus Magnetomorum sp. HK-1]